MHADIDRFIRQVLQEIIHAMRFVTDDQAKMLGKPHLAKIGAIFPARPIDTKIMVGAFELSDQIFKLGIGFDLDHWYCNTFCLFFRK